ncbi:MAG: multiple sugar transport system permease protein [Candidatus Atribacteria bacterium]|nr:multiple sugar transport system permease protein [Candidatus Atribacteria bacterium]MDI3530887.1 multiple sugar transport system permease protein [Candidatus Atribacteria bacterium]
MGRKRVSGFYIFAWIVLVLFSVWTVFPFFWSVITSFKSPGEQYSSAFLPFLQFKPSTYAWKVVLGEAEGERTLRGLKNSVLISSISSLIVLFLGAFAGYSLSRFRFRRWKNKDIAVWILSNRMFPPIAVAIPFFLIMRTLRLLDTLPAIIMAHTVYNLPLAIWLMMDFFRELPEEVEEAALIDGCSALQAFLRVALPLALPGIVAVYILCFIFSWNEFLFVVTLSYRNTMTMPVVIAGTLTVRGLDFWKVSALSLLSITPPVILAALTSRYLIRGLTLGAVKE